MYNIKQTNVNVRSYVIYSLVFTVRFFLVIVTIRILSVHQRTTC